MQFSPPYSTPSNVLKGNLIRDLSSMASAISPDDNVSWRRRSATPLSTGHKALRPPACPKGERNLEPLLLFNEHQTTSRTSTERNGGGTELGGGKQCLRRLRVHVRFTRRTGWKIIERRDVFEEAAFLLLMGKWERGVSHLTTFGCGTAGPTVISITRSHLMRFWLNFQLISLLTEA